MKPQIRLIDGLHLTATDKRNLLAVIEFERASPPEVWGTRWLGLPKSPKSYAVLPDPEKPGRYSAVIKTRERNDRGEPKIRLLESCFWPAFAPENKCWALPYSVKRYFTGNVTSDTLHPTQ